MVTMKISIYKCTLSSTYFKIIHSLLWFTFLEINWSATYHEKNDSWIAC